MEGGFVVVGDNGAWIFFLRGSLGKRNIRSEKTLPSESPSQGRYLTAASEKMTCRFPGGGRVRGIHLKKTTLFAILAGDCQAFLTTRPLEIALLKQIKRVPEECRFFLPG
jgi:hypothetical protein